MKQAITYKNIWRVTFPIVISSTAQNLVNAVDTAFLGRLGDVAVGAAGNSIIFYFVFVVVAMGFAIGGEIMVGRRNGEGNYSKVGRVLDHCIYFLIPLSLVLFMLLKFLSPLILEAVIQSPEILKYSIEFIDIRAYGIFFALINLVYRIFYVGVTNTKVLTHSTIFMASVNIVLDYLLIFGNWGMPEMGIKGAALASVIAEASTTLYFIIYTQRKSGISQYELFKWGKLDFIILKRLLKISFPIMIQSFMAIGSWLIFFLIIEKMGERELAISHIARSIYMVLIIPLFGFSAATNTLVSNIIGQGDADHVLKLVKKSVVLSMACTAVLFPAVMLFPSALISIYTNNPEIIEQGIPVLRVIGLSMLLFSGSYIVFSAVSGTGNTLISLLIESTTITIYLVITYYTAVQLAVDLPLVWCSEFIYFGIMGLLSLLYLRYGNWKKSSII